MNGQGTSVGPPYTPTGRQRQSRNVTAKPKKMCGSRADGEMRCMIMITQILSLSLSNVSEERLRSLDQTRLLVFWVLGTDNVDTALPTAMSATRVPPQLLMLPP
jgi:hypothetical protein